MWSRKWLWSVVVGSVCLLSGLMWWTFAKNKADQSKPSYLKYQFETGTWLETKEQPTHNLTITTDPNLSTINQDNNQGLRNPTILRGFFDHYDPATDLLYLKAVVPFSFDQLYELKAVKVGLQQQFYCAPPVAIDEQTGKTIDLKLYRFPVYDGQTLYTYREQLLEKESFFTRASDRTWLFLQTTKPYTDEADNYLYKLVAVGLCTPSN